MSTSDYILIFAAISAVFSTILAPLIAVQVQKWLEAGRQASDRRLNVFKVLMATRASRVSPEHVQALNMIDVEFNSKGFEPVIGSWNIYRDHLNNHPNGDEQAPKDIWLDRCGDLFADLLVEMATALNYNFDKVHIKRSIYIPEGLSEIDKDVYLLRKALISLLSGENAIKMAVVDFPDFEDSDAQRRIFEVISLLLAGQDKEEILSQLKDLKLLAPSTGENQLEKSNPTSI